MFPRGWILLTLAIPWLFIQCHHEAHILVKCLHGYWVDCHEILRTRMLLSRWFVITIVFLLLFLQRPSSDQNLNLSNIFGLWLHICKTNDIPIGLTCMWRLISKCHHATCQTKNGEHGNYTCQISACEHYHCSHVSMLPLAFRSCVQPYSAASHDRRLQI